MYISSSLYIGAYVRVPYIRARQVSYSLVRRNDLALRLYNGQKKYVQGTDAQWEVKFQLAVQTLSQARAWKVALVQLAEAGRSFRLRVLEQEGPGTGYIGPNPRVDGSNQLGTSLDCDGVTPNATIALAGDPIAVNGEFKILTADAAADGSGDVTFQFEPPLRRAPVDNMTVEVKSPNMIVAMDRHLAEWAVSLKSLHGIQLAVHEKF